MYLRILLSEREGKLRLEGEEEKVGVSHESDIMGPTTSHMTIIMMCINMLVENLATVDSVFQLITAISHPMLT